MSRLSQMGDAVVVDLPEDLSDQLGQSMLVALSRCLAEQEARVVLLDARGVVTADSYLAQVLRELGLLAQLFGAQPILVGLPAGAALVLSVLDVDLGHLHSARAMDEALRR